MGSDNISLTDLEIQQIKELHVSLLSNFTSYEKETLIIFIRNLGLKY